MAVAEKKKKEKEKEEGVLTPEKVATEQAEAHEQRHKERAEALKNVKDDSESVRLFAVPTTTNLPGELCGNPLETVATFSATGERVHDIQDDGSSLLKIMNKDHSAAIPYDGAAETGVPTQKLKVSFFFPGINPQTCQRQLLITVGTNPPAAFALPPDNGNIECLVRMNESVHCVYTDVNADGNVQSTWTLDFYSSQQ